MEVIPEENHLEEETRDEAIEVAAEEETITENESEIVEETNETEDILKEEAIEDVETTEEIFEEELVEVVLEEEKIQEVLEVLEIEETIENEEVIEEAVIEVEVEELPIVELEIEPKEIVLNYNELEKVENAKKIRFTSLHLNSLPIEGTTIMGPTEINLIKSLGIAFIKINDKIIKDCKIKIYEINKRNYLEIKTKELKLQIEINLNADGSFEGKQNNYYYNIYKIGNLKRLEENLFILIDIFKGHGIEITGEEVQGKISMGNRIEIGKLDLVLDVLKNLKEINKEYLVENKNSFYDLTLLIQSEKNIVEDTWVNLKSFLNVSKEIKSGDTLIIEREFIPLGTKQTYKEIIKLKDPILSGEIKDGKLEVFRKKCEIIVEKISKKA